MHGVDVEGKEREKNLNPIFEKKNTNKPTQAKSGRNQTALSLSYPAMGYAVGTRASGQTAGNLWNVVSLTVYQYLCIYVNLWIYSHKPSDITLQYLSSVSDITHYFI